MLDKRSMIDNANILWQQKSRPRSARWFWLPWAALCCLWSSFGERQGVRVKRTAQDFSFWEFWPVLHLFHVILKNFYMFLSISIFSDHLSLILKKDAKIPHFRAAFLLCIFFINTSWRRWRDSNSRYPFGVYTISNRARSTSYATSPWPLLYLTFS